MHDRGLASELIERGSEADAGLVRQLPHREIGLVAEQPFGRVQH
jgi:hypothetical protein